MFVYLPIEFDFAEDGVRSNTGNYQQDFDKRLLLMFENLGIKYVEIRGNMEERVLRLEERIREHKR
jgi:nicotinamide riboside kinase